MRSSAAYFTLDGDPVSVDQVAIGTRLVTVLTVQPFGKGEARLMVERSAAGRVRDRQPEPDPGAAISVALDWLDLTTDTNATEFRQDRFLAAIDWRSANSFRLAYIVRAISPGTFHHPAASVEDMYRPQFRARTETGTLRIVGMRRRFLLILAAALLLGAAGRDRFDAWIDATPLPALTAETSVEVLDRDGGLLRAYTVADGRWRLALRLEDTDPLYLEMLVAYEDKRFRDHDGVDPLAALRAAKQALTTGNVVSGGSTLTMQVARLLEDGPTGRWQGKLRQTRLALALERHLTKDQILTLYLNRAPYGGNLEGLQGRDAGLVRQGPATADPGRGGADGGAAAIARDPAARPGARGGACRPRPGAGADARGRCDRRRYRGGGRARAGAGGAARLSGDSAASGRPDASPGGPASGSTG